MARMHVVISLRSLSNVVVAVCSPRVGIINEASLNKTYLLGNRAPPLLDGQGPASHLRDHLISLTLDIFDTAVQIPRPRAQHGAVTWRHTIGARADLGLLAHHFAFEAIGGCARQKGTCTFSNAAAMSSLESLPLHRSRHRIRTCLFLSGATAANATSKNGGFTLDFLAHDHHTSWTRKLKEKSCAKKSKKE